MLIFSLAITAMAKVELTFWQYPFFREGYDEEVIAEFEAIYPEVEIELQITPWEGGPQKVETLIAVGDAPDILHDATVRTFTYMSRDLLYDFNDILTEEEKAMFLPSAYNSCTNDRGELVIFPWMAGNEPGLYVNTKLAKKAGAYDMLPFDKPNRVWTPEEFKAFLMKCKPLIKEGIYPFGYPAASEQGDNMIQCMMQQWGADLFNKENTKCVINSPEAVAFLEWVLDLQDEGLLFPNPESLNMLEFRDNFFAEDVVVFVGSMSWITAEPFKSQVTEGEYMMYPVPEGLEPRLRGWVSGPVAFNNGDPVKGKYAKLFAKYYGSRDSMIAGGSPPATKTDKIFDNRHLIFQLSLAKYAGDYEGSKFPYYKEYRAMLFPEMQAIFTRIKTPAQALADLERKVNALIE